HPVMRPAKPELRQDMVRIANEVPVGKEQKLDNVPNRLAVGNRFGELGRTGLAFNSGQIYVSHVDIFRLVCYSQDHERERIVRAANTYMAPLRRSPKPVLMN